MISLISCSRLLSPVSSFELQCADQIANAADFFIAQEAVQFPCDLHRSLRIPKIRRTYFDGLCSRIETLLRPPRSQCRRGRLPGSSPRLPLQNHAQCNRLDRWTGQTTETGAIRGFRVRGSMASDTKVFTSEMASAPASSAAFASG